MRRAAARISRFLASGLPPVLDDPFGRFGPRPVVAVERTRCHVAIELRAVVADLRLKPVEDFLGKAARLSPWRAR